MEHFKLTQGSLLANRGWINTFFPDKNIQKVYLASQIVREIIVKECIYHLLIYADLYLKTQETLEGLKVGIIGLGQIGTMILNLILQIGIIEPENIHVSTRSPDKVTRYSDTGVQLIYNNQKVAAECDLIFLCCLPFQAENVANEIKHALTLKNQTIFEFTEAHRPRSLLISLLSATPISKLKQMTDQYPFILRAYVDSEYVIENLDQKAEVAGNEEAAQAAVDLQDQNDSNASDNQAKHTQKLLDNMCGHMVGSAADLQTLLEVYNVLFFGHLEIRENVLEALTGKDLQAVQQEDFLNSDTKAAEVFEKRFKDLMVSMDLI